MSKKRKSVIQHLPVLVERQGGWFCHYCGAPLIPDCRNDDYFIDVMVRRGMNGWWRFDTKRIPRGDYRLPAVDHVIAHSRGGSDELDNLVATCNLCNWRKNNKSADEYFAVLRSEGVIR